jgi:hypothetical protein
VEHRYGPLGCPACLHTQLRTDKAACRGIECGGCCYGGHHCDGCEEAD